MILNCLTSFSGYILNLISIFVAFLLFACVFNFDIGLLLMYFMCFLFLFLLLLLLDLAGRPSPRFVFFFSLLAVVLGLL